mgnify:CR=1 FL=1
MKKKYAIFTVIIFILLVTIFTYFSTLKQNNIYAEFYKDEAIDMLYLSLAVFAADRLILRENGEDAWSREIELYMPVLCVGKWISCRSLVEEMLSFLTGDRWKICFRERKLTEIEKKAKEKAN